MPRFNRLNSPKTISSTGQVLSKVNSVKLFSANSTPTVISVMGPRMERMSDGSRSLIARLPGSGFAPRKAAVQQVHPGGDQQHRPETHHPVEIQQVERVQEQQDAQDDQHHRGHRNLLAAAVEVD